MALQMPFSAPQIHLWQQKFSDIRMILLDPCFSELFLWYILQSGSKSKPNMPRPKERSFKVARGFELLFVCLFLCLCSLEPGNPNSHVIDFQPLPTLSWTLQSSYRFLIFNSTCLYCIFYILDRVLYVKRKFKVNADLGLLLGSNTISSSLSHFPMSCVWPSKLGQWNVIERIQHLILYLVLGNHYPAYNIGQLINLYGQSFSPM